MGNKFLGIVTGITSLALVGVGAFSAVHWDDVKLLADSQPLVSEHQYTEQKQKNAELEAQFQEQLQKYTDLKIEKENLEIEKQQELDSLISNLNSQGVYFVNYKVINEQGEEVDKVKLCNGTLNASELETLGDICAWSIDGYNFLEGEVLITENTTLIPMKAGLYNQTEETFTPFSYYVEKGDFILTDNDEKITAPNVLQWNNGHINGTLVLPKGLKTIGCNAFSRLAGVTSIKLPQGLETIEDSTFNRCGITSLVIPEGVTSIGFGAFDSMPNLESIKLANSITFIDEEVFYDCEKLKTVNIPTGLAELPNYIFRDCTGLEEIYIPRTLTKIGKVAFAGCTGLKTVYIPNSVVVMGTYPWMQCPDIIVYLETSTAPAGYDAKFDYLSNSPEDGRITVKYGYTYEQYLTEINNAVVE